VEIHYDNNKLAKQCGNEKAIRRYFPNQAKSIAKRIEELELYPNLQEYLDNATGKPHPLRENLLGKFWVHINGPNVIIFEPLTEIPTDENGITDYSQITAVNILNVNVPETDFKK